MLTDLYTRGPRNLSRINVLEPYEIRYWSTRFGCTETALRSAVAEVGTMAPNVEEYLRLTRWKAQRQPTLNTAPQATRATG